MQVRGAAAALLLFGVISGRGQAPQTTPQQNPPPQNTAEMASHDAPATFSTKVNLVMVPVVVRDGKGKAIGTLQKEDFQLFDKGKPQVISTVFGGKGRGDVDSGGGGHRRRGHRQIRRARNSRTRPSPSALSIYLFDDVHTGTPDLMQARNAADRHLAETLDPATRAAIFTTSGLGNVDFTDDRAKLHEALLKLMSRPTMGAPGSECPDLTYYTADLIQNKNDQGALDTAIAEALATCAPPPPGSNTRPRRK